RPRRRVGSGEIVSVDGPASVPLGVIEEAAYEHGIVELKHGDTVVVYTDGITEAFSPPPDRVMFGEQGLESALEHCSGAPTCVIESIHERLFAHTHSRERADDQTIVAMQVK
ncbi:MAG TPA: SpoIIE family protein phosphatase, partial [Phycisphaerales bacterium]|nr:SpoIIE family protein phosphatase [Phycisphaerales bacterium]